MADEKRRNAVEKIELSIFETELAGILGILALITPFLFALIAALALLSSQIPSLFLVTVGSAGAMLLAVGILLDGYFAIRLHKSTEAIRTKYVSHAIQPRGRYSLVYGILFILSALLIILAVVIISMPIFKAMMGF